MKYQVACTSTSHSGVAAHGCIHLLLGVCATRQPAAFDQTQPPHNANAHVTSPARVRLSQMPSTNGCVASERLPSGYASTATPTVNGPDADGMVNQRIA
jgi:hypothetical protein